jgi:hypothetical protein
MPEFKTDVVYKGSGVHYGYATVGLITIFDYIWAFSASSIPR